MINDNNLLNNNKKPERKTPDSKLKANAKHNNLNYKPITIKTKIIEYTQISDYAQQKNLSLSKFCKLCVEYCMHNNIKFDD